MLTRNLSLLSTATITEPVDDVPGLNKNTAVRWQVDVIGKFSAMLKGRRAGRR
jgi:hypothetical protein